MNKEISKTWSDFFKDRKRNYFMLAGCIALTFINKFGNTFIINDIDFIAEWPFIKSFKNILSAFTTADYPQGFEGMYAPLKTVGLIFLHQIFGLQPFGYHLVGLLSHLAVGLIIYRIILHISKDDFTSFWGALLFGIHPVQTATVTSILHTLDVLGFGAYFLAFLYFIKSLDVQDKDNGRLKGLALLAYAVGVFMNPSFLHMPILLFLYGLMADEKAEGPSNDRVKGLILRLLPFGAIAVFYFSFKYSVTQSFFAHSYIFNEGYLTFLVKLKALGRYLLVTAYPVSLSANPLLTKGICAIGTHDVDKIEFLLQSFFDIPVLLISGILFLSGYFFKIFYKRHRIVSFAIAWYFLALLPFVIFPTAYLYAESYLYGALFGFSLLLAYLMRRGFKTAEQGRRTPGIACMLILCGLSLFYMGRTFTRNRDWRNTVTFAHATLESNPTYYRLHYQLGLAFLQSQRPEQALRQFHAALTIKADFVEAYLDIAEALILLRRYKQAIDVLEKAIELDPTFADAYYNLAGLYAQWEYPRRARAYMLNAFYYYKEQGREKEAVLLKKRFNRYTMNIVREKVRAYQALKRQEREEQEQKKEDL